ncbi:hypothetical protein NA63_2238 [Flavobacteriaceae bacterium MAR_2010_105]|nr:hypothetical protein NA63_2238 [Flavobacteriaceae bacterium MAR_2010_105]
MENKTGKYLKYAIGEIMLVVIGILIALQINNWNENRKNQIALKTYTQSLIKDFKQDTITLNSILKFIKNDEKLINDFGKRLSSPYATKDSLIKIFRYEFIDIIKTYRPPNDNTLLAMKANGIIELYDEDTYGLLQDLQKNHKLTKSIVKGNEGNVLNQLNNLVSKYPIREFKVIGGPIADKAWENIDADDLYRTFEGYLEIKQVSNENSGKRYLDQIEVTEKAISRLESILNDK